MNLSAYDEVKSCNKTTFVDIDRKRILTRDIKYRRYYKLLKRYNDASYDYYVAISDSKPDDTFYQTKIDTYNRVKIPIASIWNDIVISNNVELQLIEEQGDCDIYEIMF